MRGYCPATTPTPAARGLRAGGSRSFHGEGWRAYWFVDSCARGCGALFSADHGCRNSWHRPLPTHDRLVPSRAGSDSPPPKLLDRVREAIRLRHGSRSTEKSYVGWIRRYSLFHGKRHPAEMGAPEVTRFLSSLAIEGRVAASTQNQALSALPFLYRHVLHQDLPWLDDVVRAKRPAR